MRFDDKYDCARPYIACFTILRKGNLVAMVLRKNTGYKDGYWGLPAGKVEWQEPYSLGAVREAKEEAGVDIEQKDISFVHAVHRHNEDDNTFMDWVDVYFEAKTWQGEPHNAEIQKSERLEWLDITSLPDNVVPHQKDALLYIAKNISYSEFGWKN